MHAIPDPTTQRTRTVEGEKTPSPPRPVPASSSAQSPCEGFEAVMVDVGLPVPMPARAWTSSR